MFNWVRRKFTSSQSQTAALKQVLPGELLIQHLVNQISAPGHAASVLERVERFQNLPPIEQEGDLPAVYLLLEQFLAEVDPLRKYSRVQLREIVRTQYTGLLEVESFSLIFEPERLQEILLCRHLLQIVLQRAATLMGSELDTVLAWTATVPQTATLPLPFGLSGSLPTQDQEWVLLLRKLSRTFCEMLENRFGEQTAQDTFEHGYEVLAERYMGLETFPVVIKMLPKKILDEQKISLLSHRQMQRALLDHVRELQRINDELLLKNDALQKTQIDLIKARESAMASSAQFRAVLDTVGDGIVTFDEHGRIVLVNQEVQHTWGYRQRELSGQNIQVLLEKSHQLTRPFQNDFTLRADIAKLLGKRLEMKGVRKGGAVFPVEIKITETKIGERLFYTATVNDITERKLMEQTLAQAHDLALESNDLKSRLLASVSHDLRTPLNTIVGYADMLHEEVYGELTDDQKDVLKRVLRGGNQMSTLIHDLLEQAQVQGGQVTIQMKPFAPSNLINNIQSLMTLTARQKGLTLRCQLDPRVPDKLLGDQERLQQVLNNLVSNAIKFTEEGHVDVRIFCPDADHWIMKVSDTGCGIPLEAQTTIFEPFQRMPSLKEAKQDGVGLGLSIVKQLVSLMEGTITLSSEVGKGTIFAVTFPLISVQGTTT